MANSTSQDEYYPIYIARSDGKGYTNLDHHALKETEDKDVEQLERWEVIIAGHLAMQLAPKEKGYELRCAIRRDGGRDYYLYGHPAGPKSNYRTPGDFVLHLLWLVSDSTDYTQCSCDLCTRMVEGKQAEGASKHRRRAAPHNRSCRPVGRIRPATSAAVQYLKRRPEANPSGYFGLRGDLKHGGDLDHGGPAKPGLAEPHIPADLPAPGTTGLSNVFRIGELVWYRQTAWRLGLILAIMAAGADPTQGDSNYSFVLAPLGHAILQQQNVTKSATDLRPFLTFSVPGVSIDELEDKAFDAVDWQQFALRYAQAQSDPNQQAVRKQMVGLEASKMAARAINDSFSTFSRVGEVFTSDHMHRIQIFAGVYLGAEMILVGDPIRVSAPQANGVEGTTSEATQESTAIMLVAEILLIYAAWPEADAQAMGTHQPSLNFKGKVYRIVRAPLPHPPTFVPAETLGLAFEQELAARNRIERDSSMRWGWCLIERDAHAPRSRFRDDFMSLIS